MPTSRMQCLLLACIIVVCVAEQTCVLTSLGCKTDNTNNVRALSLGPIDAKSFWEAPLDQNTCVAYCSRFHVQGLDVYAAVEYGSQCFCGASINPAANVTSRPESECNVCACSVVFVPHSARCTVRVSWYDVHILCCESQMPCPGNATQMCGAADRMNLFTFQCTGTPTPAYQGCVRLHGVFFVNTVAHPSD
jgi:hypothetical protein